MGKFVLDEATVKKDREMAAIFRKQQLRGGLFSIGMFTDLVYEGWDNPDELREQFKPQGEKKQRLIDGVISVTSTFERDMIEKVQRVKEHFLKESDVDNDTYVLSNDPSIEFPLIRVGNSLPGSKEQWALLAPGRGGCRELTFLSSFGYNDGISQPKIEGLDDLPKGREPKAVKPG